MDARVRSKPLAMLFKVYDAFHRVLEIAAFLNNKKLVGDNSLPLQQAALPSTGILFHLLVPLQ